MKNKKEQPSKSLTLHTSGYSLIGFLSCIVCIIMLLGYCISIKSQYGEFGLTTISEVNSIMSCLSSNAYRESNSYEIIKKIDELIANGRVMLYSDAVQVVKDEFDEQEIKEFISSTQKTNQYKKYLLSKVFAMAPNNICANYSENDVLKSIDKFLIPVSFRIIYMVIIISIVYLCYNLIKKKQIDWILAFCISLITGNLLTIIISSPLEVERLFLPSIIQVLILASYIAEKLTQKIYKGDK